MALHSVKLGQLAAEELTELITELATLDLLEILDVLEALDLLEILETLDTLDLLEAELVAAPQAPRPVHALAAAQPTPGSYGPPVEHHPPTSQR